MYPYRNSNHFLESNLRRLLLEYNNYFNLENIEFIKKNKLSEVTFKKIFLKQKKYF